MPRNEFKAGDEESFDELLEKAEKPKYKLKIDEIDVDLPRPDGFVPPYIDVKPYEHMHEWEIRAHEEAVEAAEPPGEPTVNVLSPTGLEALQKRAAEGSVTAQHQLDLLMRDRER